MCCIESCFFGKANKKTRFGCLEKSKMVNRILEIEKIKEMSLAEIQENIDLLHDQEQIYLKEK